MSQYELPTLSGVEELAFEANDAVGPVGYEALMRSVVNHAITEVIPAGVDAEALEAQILAYQIIFRAFKRYLPDAKQKAIVNHVLNIHPAYLEEYRPNEALLRAIPKEFSSILWDVVLTPQDITDLVTDEERLMYKRQKGAGSKNWLDDYEETLSDGITLHTDADVLLYRLQEAANAARYEIASDAREAREMLREGDMQEHSATFENFQKLLNQDLVMAWSVLMGLKNSGKDELANVLQPIFESVAVTHALKSDNLEDLNSSVKRFGLSESVIDKILAQWDADVFWEALQIEDIQGAIIHIEKRASSANKSKMFHALKSHHNTKRGK